jgi:hypothetical protein
MSDATWSSVEEYFESRLLPADPVLEAALEASEAAGLVTLELEPRHAEVVRRMTDWIGREPRLSATVIQPVGNKGYDGFLLARVQ